MASGFSTEQAEKKAKKTNATAFSEGPKDDLQAEYQWNGPSAHDATHRKKKEQRRQKAALANRHFASSEEEKEKINHRENNRDPVTWDQCKYRIAPYDERLHRKESIILKIHTKAVSLDGTDHEKAMDILCWEFHRRS
jgi:hypothetical protein